MVLMSTEPPLSSASATATLNGSSERTATGIQSPQRPKIHRTPTKAGERRSAPKAENRRLLPEAVERDLHARARIRGSSCEGLRDAGERTRANPSEPDRLKGIGMSRIGHNRRGANPTRLYHLFSSAYAPKLAPSWKIRGLRLDSCCRFRESPVFDCPRPPNRRLDRSLRGGTLGSKSDEKSSKRGAPH